MRTLAVLLIVAILSSSAGSVVRGSTTGSETYFRFTDGSSSTFVIRLTDPATIQTARDILARKLPLLTSLMGKIIKSPAPYNPPWTFYLNSSTIQFGEATIEVCQSLIQYVQDHLSEVGGVFLPNNVWCPGAKLLQEISLGPWQGDVNHDCKVDIQDIALIAYSYRATSGSLRWNPNADLNNDGIIDMLDVAIAASNFGTAC